MHTDPDIETLQAQAIALEISHHVEICRASDVPNAPLVMGLILAAWAEAKRQIGPVRAIEMIRELMDGYEEDLLDELPPPPIRPLN